MRGTTASPTCVVLFGIEVDTSVSSAALRRGASTDGRERRSWSTSATRPRPDAGDREPRRRCSSGAASDGRLVMSVDHDPERRLSRVCAAQRPSSRLARRNAHRFGAPSEIAPWRWQRLLFAQVLPLAATLQGLELLHASAVEWNGRALGFVARAGTGKTSVAAHIVASGGDARSPTTYSLSSRSRAQSSPIPASSTVSIDAAELGRMSTTAARRVGQAARPSGQGRALRERGRRARSARTPLLPRTTAVGAASRSSALDPDPSATPREQLQHLRANPGADREPARRSLRRLSRDRADVLGADPARVARGQRSREPSSSIVESR